MSSNNTIIRAVRPSGGELADIRIANGLIAEIGGPFRSTGSARVIDGHCALLLPGLVNAHAHIDKTFWNLPWQSHSAGPTVADRIANERRLLRALQLEVDVQCRALIERMVVGGTTHIRSHVDIDPELRLRHFESVAALRESLRSVVDLQLVAFPQSGIIRAPGTADLLDEALRNGAEVVGGVDPMGLDRDPAGQLDIVFSLAERHAAEVDIHLHDPGEMGAITIEMIAERSKALGMQGKVVVSHAFCLASLEQPRFEVLATLLHDADIAIMSHAPSGATPCPPIRALHERGVRVFSGTDGVRDAWGPLNGPDMLERAYLVAYVNGFRDDAGLDLAFNMVSYHGAEVMKSKAYGVEVGCRADLLLLDAENIAEAVVSHPLPKHVFKAGNLIASNGDIV